MTVKAPLISIVVPAYNEEKRLGTTLASICGYFDKRAESYEVLVVDDGSTDSTAKFVKEMEGKFKELRLLTYPRNRGKGYAVKFGMTNAKGDLLLFDDADGASPIEEIERLRQAISEGADIAIGSRAVFSKETGVKAVWYRKLLGRAFSVLVRILVLPEIADTQCGFKLFTRKAGDYLFSRQQAEGFSFDVELLFLARQAGFQIAEVPINWTNIPGSKVNLVKDSFFMAVDLLRFRIRALFGGYRLEEEKK